MYIMNVALLFVVERNAARNLLLCTYAHMYAAGNLSILLWHDIVTDTQHTINIIMWCVSII